MKAKLLLLIAGAVFFMSSCSDSNDEVDDALVAEVTGLKVEDATDDQLDVIHTTTYKLKIDLVMSNGETFREEVVDFKFSSSNPEVAEVDERGFITAHNLGSSELKVIYKNKESLTATVKIKVEPNLVTKVTLSEQEKKIFLQETFDVSLGLKVAPEAATNREVGYVSLNPAVATVDAATGIVTGLTLGEAKIVVTSKDGADVSDTCLITVAKPVTSITVSEGNEEITLVKATMNISSFFTVAPEDASDREVVYTTSDATIATVDTAGIVTPVTAGETTITITAKDGSGTTATIKAIVNAPAKINGFGTAWYVGGEFNLHVAAGNNKGNRIQLPEGVAIEDLEFTSSDPAIAEVDANGKVTCKAVGEVIISIVAKDGSSEGESKVFVKEETKLLTGITHTTNSRKVIQVANGKTTDAVTNGNIKLSGNTDKAILRYNIANPNIVRDNGDGTFTALKRGNCNVDILSTDGSNIEYNGVMSFMVY